MNPVVSQRPFWLDSISEADFTLPGGSLQGVLPDRARVVIIGGGVIGLACAYYLAQADFEGVLLLEKGDLLHQASGANGGGIWPGEEAPGGGVFHDLGRASQKLIEGLASEVDLQYRRNGVLSLARNRSEAEVLRADTERRAREGLEVEWIEPAEIARLEPNLNPAEYSGAARYARDGHLHPGRLGAHLAREAQRGEVTVRTGVTVHGIEEGDHTTRVFTDQGSVICSHLIVTTGAWASDWEAFLGIRIPVEPAKGQLVATPVQPPLLSHAIMSRYGMFQTVEGHILAGGTIEYVGFDPEPSGKIVEAIWDDVQTLVPALRGVPLTHSWARFRPHTPDGLPLVGRCGRDDRHLIATGHFRNGLLLSAVTGKIVADLLTRGDTRYPIAALAPGRFADLEPGAFAKPEACV